MPDSRMIQKAGKISFLLVCLFLCSACGTSKAVFEAGTAIEVAAEQEETAENKIPESKESFDKERVNINTADEAELMTLPGIGKVRAAAIIEYRQQAGKFEKIEDIMNVKGIKTGIFSKIKNLITVE